MKLDPRELRSYILGLEMAKNLAKKYVGIDMINYIGHLEEMIDQAQHIDGYREWLNGQPKKVSDEH